MKSNELVWRTIADHAVGGVRQWDSLAQLGVKAGVPTTTAHLATRKLVEIGAISPNPSGGLFVTNVEKVFTVLYAWRNIARDTLATTTRVAVEQLLPQHSGATAWGGPDAAVHLLGNVNPVAHFSQTLFYVDQAQIGKIDWPAGDEVMVLEMDARAAIEWTGFSSVAQTLADLFATAGWQANEFRYALEEKFLTSQDHTRAPVRVD